MKEVTINYLGHDRSHYFNTIFGQLVNIKPENKELIEVNIFVSYEVNPLINLNLLLDNGIDAQIIYDPVQGRHYMSKVERAVEISKEYSVSLDEDVFINNHIWDFLIENRNELDREDVLLMCPLLSTGLPMVDWFVEQFFDDDTISYIHNLFKNIKFEPRSYAPPGCEVLNKCTMEADEWDYENFYSEVHKMDTYYKGIHPVRFSGDIQEKLLLQVLNNKRKLFEKFDYSIFSGKDRPYFCNNMFMMKTENWRKFVFDTTLFVDRFEEVPLNRFRDMYDLDMLYINNAFGVHPAYNWMGMDRYREMSDWFFHDIST